PIYPLRVLSSFWLTADSSTPLKLANTSEKCLSQGKGGGSPSRLKRRADSSCGQHSQTLQRGRHVRLTPRGRSSKRRGGALTASRRDRVMPLYTFLGRLKYVGHDRDRE